MSREDVAILVTADIVRKGLTKVPVIKMTDGVDTWELGIADSFTIEELKQRFPFFHNPAKSTNQSEDL